MIEDANKDESQNKALEVEKMIALFEENEKKIYGSQCMHRTTLFIENMNFINESKKKKQVALEYQSEETEKT